MHEEDLYTSREMVKKHLRDLYAGGSASRPVCEYELKKYLPAALVEEIINDRLKLPY